MISSIHLERFRTFRDTTLNLGPFTVLVGPNGSGKSSLLKVMDPVYGLTEADRWHRRTDLPTVVTVLGTKRWVRRVGPGSPDGERFFTSQVLNLDVSQLRAHVTVHEATQLKPDGGDLVNVFATLSRPQQSEVVEEFCELVPLFKDVHAKPYSGGSHRLVFQDRWTNRTWYEPGEVSDGSILAFALTVLRHQTSQPDLIAFEDLERGLHPFLLSRVMDLLRSIAGQSNERMATQIVIATHSPTVLELSRPEEVRFLTRRDHEVIIQEAPTTEPEWKAAYREYSESLGDVWLSGSLGGVPGT